MKRALSQLLSKGEYHMMREAAHHYRGFILLFGSYEMIMA